MSVFVIGEIGVNGMGDMGEAKRLIQAAIHADADAVKFQLFRDRPEIEHLRFSEPQMETLHAFCNYWGAEFMCTPFYLEAVAFLDPLVKRHKIASGWLDNEEFMDAIWETKKPVIISTGKSSIQDIQRVTRIHWSNVSILHCVSKYPCPDNEANLKRMIELESKCLDDVGYSDHTIGITACVAAVALGAKIIEKHITFDKTAEGPDHACSAEPEEFAEMVRQIRRVERMLGDGGK